MAAVVILFLLVLASVPDQAPPVRMLPDQAPPTKRFDVAQVVVPEQKEQVRPPMAAPFPLEGSSLFPPEEDQPKAADDKKEAASSRPEFELPEGFQTYRRARFTQEIAVTNNRDRISLIPRVNNERKWQVSGGMEHLTGWKSTVYKKVPGQVIEQVINLPVKNSFNFIQYNRGWSRAYPDGTEFMDVLSNVKTGKVFEARLASKKDGKWTRSVEFRDRDERPTGYQHVALHQCTECHNQAGTGAYAAGLVPGGDTVISDPFVSLEGR